MADKFGQFFKDTLKEILVEHVKELKNLLKDLMDTLVFNCILQKKK